MEMMVANQMKVMELAVVYKSRMISAEVSACAVVEYGDIGTCV